MARKEKNMKTQDLVITDPESEQELTFSKADQARYYALKDRIQNNLFQVAMDLKSIRDSRFYLIEGYDSMKEWLLEHFSQSYRTAKYLMEAADKMSDLPQEQLQNIMHAPLHQIRNLANDEDTLEKLRSGEIEIADGHVILPTGDHIDLPSYIKQIRKELTAESQKKEQKLSDQLKTAKDQVRALKQQNSSLAELMEDKDKEIEKAERIVAEISAEKDLDPKMYAIMTHKKDAIERIQNSLSQTLSLIGVVDNLPYDLVDAEVAGHMRRFISSVEAGLERVRDGWRPVIYAAGAELDGSEASEEGMVP